MATEVARRSAPRAVHAPQLLRFATAGSVDDGKSTLIGRLLYDSKALMADQVADAELDLARLTDGLRAEREQGITIDVAYRHFSTPRRRFIIADTPGHAQYTRNMVTGASTADVAVVLVDAREGLLAQSRRHATIAGLLRIPRVVLAVNKMDLVDYDQDVFRRICAEFRSWASGLDVEEITCIPISALLGDNVVERSERLDWFRGPTLLQFLETAPVTAGVGGGPLRFPVQYVIRRGEQRAYAGQLAGGTVRAGDEVVVLPGGLTTRVAAVEGPAGPLESAGAPLSVALRLEDEVDAGRGAMICSPDELPRSERDIEATVCWLGESPARPGVRYVLKHTTRSERARLETVHGTLSVATLQLRPDGDSLGLNDIGRVSLRCASELVFDPYSDNRTTGAFILIDEATNDTVGAGMIAETTNHTAGRG
jgi:bifunctional enzyme CysN/CysC